MWAEKVREAPTNSQDLADDVAVGRGGGGLQRRDQLDRRAPQADVPVSREVEVQRPANVGPLERGVPREETTTHNSPR